MNKIIIVLLCLYGCSGCDDYVPCKDRGGHMVRERRIVPVIVGKITTVTTREFNVCVDSSGNRI